MFLATIGDDDLSIAVGGNHLSDDAIICVTVRRQGLLHQRIQFTEEELTMLHRVIAIPSNIICKFTMNGCRWYTVTWMESDTSGDLDSIYLSVNFDDDAAIIVRPPLAEQFVSVIATVVDLLKTHVN